MHRVIRQAVPGDLESLYRLDPLAATDAGRRALIETAVGSSECWVALGSLDARVPVGYGCLNQGFFGQWFISLVVVSTAHRRCGVGRQIVAHLERVTGAEKIFTSTNASNVPMRQLLAQSGFQASGVVENLDPGDPELIFVKFLSR
ncbi:GNAT family N-acetyltransferase [Pseudomonas sp. COR58]|uniref:GNAT family N-acetyltransferase n=1 Tax=Pseudomonas ekonensis TaxID=2842353 RepID=A0ABS6PF76_9PSED|nr:GNAT family N-acetyltransferase [Pseudomonas ekonensis]MBV4458636.1 GNAT family N-acetyltransferase [Pseudomonas ekonensis]